jgi:hypothetical protein
VHRTLNLRSVDPLRKPLFSKPVMNRGLPDPIIRSTDLPFARFDPAIPR